MPRNRISGRSHSEAPRISSAPGRSDAQIVETALPDGDGVDVRVPDDLAVIADPLVIDRVVSNLLLNACRYGSPPITIEAEQRDRHLRLYVEDSGEGVPEELRPRLFERFARAESSSGSGLGLAIARAYARAHGGDLVYHPSEHGARFELIVPQG